MADVTSRVLSIEQMNRLSAAIPGTFGMYALGGAVTVSANMVLNVAAVQAGTYRINGADVGTAYVASTVTVSASDPTNPRLDIVWINSSGVVAVAAGTPAAITTSTGPVPPTIGATGIELAMILVGAGVTAITANDIIDRRQSLIRPVLKYTTATQTRNADTTFVDVIAAGLPATMAFWALASTVYRVEYELPLSFTGTGGFKGQLTGPAGVTAVSIRSFVPLFYNTGGAQIINYEAAVTAFSTAFAAHNAAAATDNIYSTGVAAANLRVVAYISNGATAGAVTLQMGQNSANGTTIMGIGATMRVEVL